MLNQDVDQDLEPADDTHTDIDAAQSAAERLQAIAVRQAESLLALVDERDSMRRNPTVSRQERKDAEALIVETFESEMDRVSRERSKGRTIVRGLVGLVRSLGWLLISLPVLGWCWRRERVAEAELGDRLTYAALDPKTMPTTLMPLGDFERFGLTMPNDAGRRFALLTPVGYDIVETGPIGESLDPGFTTLQHPLLPDLRFIPAGFITDFASIPGPMRRFIGHPAGHFVRAAIVHDWAYAYHHDGSAQGRKDCDEAMVGIMRVDGVTPLRRAAIYLGLRVGGGIAYRLAPKRREGLRPQCEEIVFPLMSAQTYSMAYTLTQLEAGGFLEGVRTPGETADGDLVTVAGAVAEATMRNQLRAFGELRF